VCGLMVIVKALIPGRNIIPGRNNIWCSGMQCVTKIPHDTGIMLSQDGVMLIGRRQPAVANSVVVGPCCALFMPQHKHGKLAGLMWSDRWDAGGSGTDRVCCCWDGLA
jgi:hypothetical protein